MVVQPDLPIESQLVRFERRRALELIAEQHQPIQSRFAWGRLKVNSLNRAELGGGASEANPAKTAPTRDFAIGPLQIRSLRAIQHRLHESGGGPERLPW